MDYKIYPDRYWKEKGKTYYNNFNFDGELIKFQEEQVVKYLKKNVPIQDVTTVIEVGIGFGRYTKILLELFPHIERYRAIDLSFDQLKIAKKYVNDNRVSFSQSSIQEYHDDQCYDLLFACELFFQIPPSDIEKVMYKTLSYAKKHFIHVDPEQQFGKDKLFFFDNEQNLQDYAFFHNYDGIIKKIDFPHIDQKYIPLKKIHQAIYNIIL